jgi:hypothetical protein
MFSVTFVRSEETITIPVLQAINKYGRFQNNLTLAASPYHVQSTISLSILREFVSEFERA